MKNKSRELEKKWVTGKIAAGKYMSAQTQSNEDVAYFKRLCSFANRSK